MCILYLIFNGLSHNCSGDPWELRRPTQSVSSHGKEEWEAVMEMAKEDARRVPLPPDFFQVISYPSINGATGWDSTF